MNVAWSLDGTRVATASNDPGEIWRPQGATACIGHTYLFAPRNAGVATIAISLDIFILVEFIFTINLKPLASSR